MVFNRLFDLVIPNVKPRIAQEAVDGTAWAKRKKEERKMESRTDTVRRLVAPIPAEHRRGAMTIVSSEPSWGGMLAQLVSRFGADPDAAEELFGLDYRPGRTQARSLMTILLAKKPEVNNG